MSFIEDTREGRDLLKELLVMVMSFHMSKGNTHGECHVCELIRKASKYIINVRSPK